MNNMNLQTVERALCVLELISLKKMSAQDIEKSMGLNRTTVARLIYTLQNKGYIEKDENDGMYKLGLKVVEVASLKLNQLELKTEAVPLLRELSLKLNQVCHMGTLSGGEVVYIEKIEPITSIRMFSAIGHRMPVHCTSLGKALLSGHEDNEVVDILKSKGMNKLTEHTHTDIDEVLSEIEFVRKNGYGIDDEENEPSIYCVSAPIMDYRGKIIAAISTSGKIREYIMDDTSAVVVGIKDTARKISEKMGFVIE